MPEHVEVTFSSSLKRRLGRALPTRGRVLLSETLRSAPSAVLREVLVHELAHIVAFRQHGASAKPHGAEWRGLVSGVGFPARTALPAGPSEVRRKATGEYLYFCPVCQARRRARRPMPRWRCAACVAQGLEGRLVLEGSRR